MCSVSLVGEPIVRAMFPVLLVCFAWLSACVPHPSSIPPLTCATQSDAASADLLFVSFRRPVCGAGGMQLSDWRHEPGAFGYRNEQARGGASHGTDFLVEETAWWDRLGKQVGEASGRPPVVLIHGFNNSHNDAMRRGAALRFLHLSKRPVVVISWPSFSKFYLYTWAEANDDWASEPIKKFLSELTRRYPGTDLVAHSMGSRILANALLAPSGTDLRPGKIIMAAPDIDRQLVQAILRRDTGFGLPVVIYASRADQVMSASWRVHGNPRAGDLSTYIKGRVRLSPLPEVRNAVILDTTDVRGSWEGHRDILNSPEAAADVCRVLEDQPVGPGRKPVTGAANYWDLVAASEPDPCALRNPANPRDTKRASSYK